MKLKNNFIKILLVAILVIIGIISILRFSTPEDTWLCTKNGWEKHGNPNSLAPTTECPKIK